MTTLNKQSSPSQRKSFYQKQEAKKKGGIICVSKKCLRDKELKCPGAFTLLLPGKKKSKLVLISTYNPHFSAEPNSH